MSRSSQPYAGPSQVDSKASPTEIRTLAIRSQLFNRACPPQARNGLVHGGQIGSDLSTIDLEEDPAEYVMLWAGFENLYVVSLSLRFEFRNTEQ